MRKVQKQQAEELVKQMEEAHEQIKKDIGQGNVQSAMELLEDCQNGGITIGTLIEEAEGEGHPTVLLLEDYCELIYQIHTDLTENKEVNANKVYKLLKQKLIKAGNSLRNDIQIRKEAVFLPYKASMWDSLESVWKAADEDPNCDAYVIPIPYYDKNPDGSFRQMHYEGDQYPDYVPITKYDAFDFEAHRPDMIYIHNPYDDLNLVTSVPPFFFSKNLKKYTDKLVYIPYFILGEIKPDEDEKIEGMKHFCTTPGVFNADKVIVQSEDMKQVYIKVLLDATNDHSEVARKYWDNKILGTGSPKIDKVLNTKKEDLEVPQEWLKIIEKQDGSWKKIIFYNTSVGALLQHNEKMLQKMESVFGIFQENQDEVALLWRPHPLIKATVESMRPQLWMEYDRLVRKYREEGWGIYDDSSDIDRAIALSDAYYGDGSSVLNLYKLTEKPYMYQIVDSLPEYYDSLAMENIIKCQDKWWFWAFEDNGLYQMDMETLEAVMVLRIPWDKTIKNYGPQYGKIYCFQNKIFIIPWVPIKIVVYDIENKSIHYIDYEREEAYRGMVFLEGIVDENILYLIPCAYENIVCIDMGTEDITYIRLNEALGEKDKKHQFAWGSVFYEGKSVYMTMLKSNRIIGCELKTGKVKVYQSELIEGGAIGICGNKNSVWVMPYETNRIIYWDRKRKFTKSIDVFPDKYEAGEFSFHKIVLCGRCLYLLPRIANMCLVMDTETGKIDSLELKEYSIDKDNFYDKYLRYANIWEYDDEIYIVNARRGDIYCIDARNGNVSRDVKRIKLLMKDEEAVEINGDMERENRFENLSNFIRTLSNKRKDI